MKKVLVLGCCGAGKTTLSSSLAEILNIPHISLDQHYWNPGWVETPKDKWLSISKSLANQPQWVMDGNYGSSLDYRIAKADTIVYLDFNTISCLYRITKRTVNNYKKVRPMMAEGCPERFDVDFFHYVATFNLTRRKPILKKLSDVKNNKSIFILENDKQVAKFLESITPT